MTDHREYIREKFLPEKITTLFIGESVPNNGGFFYDGSNALLTHFKTVIESQYGQTDDFLATFKSYGWYLDDLVMEPVDHLSKTERKAKSEKAVPGLTARINKYNPEAVVCFLIRIDKFVNEAVKQSTVSLKFEYTALPFPGFGNQERFKVQFKQIVGKLPRL